MPGILPMKMIRVGTNSQSRIAQACDRCRSKKIRCDGVRPCCSQCSSVGFECKTSDKLSRRAFPRGYTESLEDRVRALEAEIRDLKVLLDEKDEKLDILSRIHNFSSQSKKRSVSPNASYAAKVEAESPREEVILVELPVAVQPAESTNGTPRTAALIEAFEEKVHNSDRPCPVISASTLLKPYRLGCERAGTDAQSTVTPVPPRLLSDQYINIFFQEWQPLLPILHRPTFLRVYEQYLLDSDAQSWQKNRHAVAQLFLIFEISAHSSSSRTRPATNAYEFQWRKALSANSSTPILATLQSHILAQLCCLLKADYPHLLRHRAYAVSMVHQLCLHQGHKSHSLPTFEAETRKKVFWCQYVLDKFVSATTGTPQLLHDVDVSVGFPADVDDENINTYGVSPALPGELTKISSAFALFRGSQILARTLTMLYPSKSSYQLSITKLHSLSDELDQWQEELPDHLRLRFCNDKPATNLISCRSPILSLVYFYIRSLIHRPLVYYGKLDATSSATIVLAAAAKHQLQILDLLDERSMNYTFPLSKQDLLLNAGFSILWQSVGLDDDGKLIRDNQRSLILLLNKLSKENQPAGIEFRKIAASFVALPEARSSPSHIETNGNSSAALLLGSMPAPFSHPKSKSARKQLQAMASRLSTFSGKGKTENGTRRASMSQPGLYQSLSVEARANSTTSLSSTKSAPVLPTNPTIVQPTSTTSLADASHVNLDYFPLLEDMLSTPSNNSSSTMLPPGNLLSQTGLMSDSDTWGQMINGMGLEKGVDTGSPVLSTKQISLRSTSESTPPVSHDLVSEGWSISDTWHFSADDMDPRTNGPQSLFSLSEESLTSGDEVLFSATESHNGSTSTNDTLDIQTPIGVQSQGIDRDDSHPKRVAMPEGDVAIDDEFEFYHELET